MGALEASAALYDLHLHLDWYREPGAAARALAADRMGCLGCTVTPDGYEALVPQVAGVPGVRAALGLHPWYLGRPDVTGGVEAPFSPARAADQLDRFCEQAPSTRWIGEVGLDFGRAHEADRYEQVAALRRLCLAVAPGSVLSLHAVRSVPSVLEVLEATGRARDCACVFHWFSGTSDDLAAARRLGCWFSVGPFMLRSKRGREYARQIPAGRLLLETDLPEGRGATMAVAAHRALLADACGAIATLKRVDETELAATVAENGAALLG